MPGTVDDFIQRFSGPQTMDDQQASHYLDRFASDHPQDSEFDRHDLSSGATEYLGKLPENEFQQAAQNAYASATPQQQQGLVGSLMSALQSRGANLGALGALFGRPGSNTQLSPGQYAQLANAARQQHPEAMQEVVHQNPWFIRAMGNPIVMGALGMAASRMIKNRSQSQQPVQSGAGGILGRLF